MIERNFKNAIILFSSLGWFFLTGLVQAEEKLVKKEKMSFERCLSVIDVSKDKLSITPKISEFSERKRVAIFDLLDGTLSITCDGSNGFVSVTTTVD